MTNKTLMISAVGDEYYVYCNPDGPTIANLANKFARDLFVTGAAMAKLSVYDTDTHKYLCGTIDELMGGQSPQD
jgi:hypothetical protein